MSFIRCPLRIISVIVLSFFLWTFGGVFDIAYAIKNDTQHSSKGNEPKAKKPEETFEAALEKIRDSEDKANKKLEKGEGTEDEEKEIKNKRNDLDKADLDIKKQFKETEDKIKGLPGEIRQRHRDFVKKYEENFKELQANLDEIEKARTKGEKERAHGKTKEFLEKTKPPKKHKPLDQDKLPHRTPEIREYNVIERQAESRDDKPTHTLNNPILVASSDSLAGLLAQATFTSAAATQSLPTAADLSQTVEVQFTPEIQAKAAELGHNPVKIYEYVRNNFEYEPYYGSLKGAQQTLLERAGNDFDQASLLISLLRASNIPAKYVYGTLEIPIVKLMNWVGGVTDPNTAATILATAGVPGMLLTEGGKIKYAQMEHCWVEAYVPYGNYRGSMRDDSIKTWIPLDPSFKQYEYKRGMDLYTAMGINGEQYIQDYITDTSPSPIPAELQSLFPDYSVSPYQFYGRRLLNYIDTNFPDSTIEDIIGGETIEQAKPIINKEYPYLLGSLPYKVVVKGVKYSSIPDNPRHGISFSIGDPLTFETSLSYSVSLPEIAGKRVTLSYIPASSADENLVTQYGGLLNVPPYLLQVKPVIKAAGITVATGLPVGLGYEQTFTMSFRMPSKGTDVVTNKVTAGDYSAIAIQYYKTSLDVVSDRMQTLQNNRTSADLDDLLGQMLYNIGISYMHHLTFEEELYAKNFQMVITKEPSEGIVTSPAVTEYLWGMPYRVTEGGIGIDVDRNVKTSFPIDGDRARAKDFMIISGLGSSAWEDMTLESFFNIPSVSAARLLKTASKQGVPIYTIDSRNINTVLPQLQLASEVINDVRNSINAGKKVIVSKTNIQYNGWNGVGYIILDPVKGSGAYMISGGLAGASMSFPMPTSLREIEQLYRRLCEYRRTLVLSAAVSALETPYKFGCKDPTVKCRGKQGIDCSGLVEYAYKQAGFSLLSGKNAQGQYDVTIQTDYPLSGDLVFYRGTYDKNEDCYKNESDGITHVGIVWAYGFTIAAQGTKVDFYPLSDILTRSESVATGVICKKGSSIPTNSSKPCPRVDGCTYTYSPTGRTFISFMGFRYTPEFFDKCY